jgi:hypothetical protein
MEQPRDSLGRWKAAGLFFGLWWIPGALLVGMTLAAVDLIAKMWTGISQVDALAPATAAGVLTAFRPVTPGDFTTAIFAARSLAAIANAESSFNGAVGDTDASSAPGGPSISPWQIERVNAIKLGWYSPPDGSSQGDETDRDTYAAISTTGISTFLWAYRAAVFFRDQVLPHVTVGNFDQALEVWNGGPGEATDPDNQDYADKSSALIAEWSAQS